jgi:hypothetical protein
MSFEIILLLLLLLLLLYMWRYVCLKDKRYPIICILAFDDILITYDTTNTNINDTLSDFNDLHHKIQFTIENEINNQINFLDLTISKHHNNLHFGIYRKHTTTDIMIRNDSCHPNEHKMSGINYLINRITTYPITHSNLNVESQIINHLLKSNGCKHLETNDLVQKKEKRVQKENIN